MKQVTLKEIYNTVRDLCFDRSLVPSFTLKGKGGDFTVIVTPTKITESLTEYGSFKVTNNSNVNVVLSFEDIKTLSALTEGLVKNGVVIAFTPYFRGDSSVDDLLEVTAPLTDDLTVFLRNFNSETDIRNNVLDYYNRVLEIPITEITDEIVNKLQRPSEVHLSLWTAYQLTDKRRLYESAAQFVSGCFTDGSDYSGFEGMSSPVSTSVNIGSVFSITESNAEGYFSDDFNQVGSDNIFGDRYSFWYKLMLYLRDQLESRFGDYRLRKNQVISGNINLERELDFRSYFDSYPFTLSPLARGVASRHP